jgi:hypothetical protein
MGFHWEGLVSVQWQVHLTNKMNVEGETKKAKRQRKAELWN